MSIESTTSCEEHRHLLVLRRLSGPCEWRAALAHNVCRPRQYRVTAGQVSSVESPAVGWLAITCSSWRVLVSHSC